jgi:predicted dehydrogenase
MINAAIVGLGRWGRLLVDSVQDKSDRIRFTAGVTRTLAKAEDYCRSKNIALTGDYAAVLRDPKIDAVVLATPHTQHFDQIMAAAAAKKHVFCEKPFTLSRATAERAVKACTDAGLAVAIGHNRRYMHNFQELKRMVAAGELGRILHVEGNFSADISGSAEAWRGARAESPAGGMTSLGIHVVDAMLALSGSIVEVDARSYRQAMPFDVDDTTMVFVRFANGSTGYLGTVAYSAALWHVRVLGTKGWAQVHGATGFAKGMVGAAEESKTFAPNDSLKAELEAFAAAAEGKGAFAVTPDQIVHGTAVLEAIVKSAERGRPEPVG